METLEAIAGRWSCRDFGERGVSDEDLRKIARAGAQAPSGMNRQNWQIIVVRDRALIEELDKAGIEFMREWRKSGGHAPEPPSGGLFYHAPAMIYIAIKEAMPKGAELIDLGIVAQNICLAATSLGVDNCHCGFAVFPFAGDRGEEFKARLKFPKGYECGMAVLLGYAVKVGKPHVADEKKITVL